MNGRDLKQRWKSGDGRFGTWITLADPAVCTIMANIGFEWVILDAEHCPFNPQTLRDMLLLLRHRGVVPIIRIRANEDAIVKQVLDWGAEGIMFPLIRTVEDAQKAVAACRYPPVGVRGFNPRDVSNFFQDVEEYAATANDRIIVILQVEHRDAVANLDGILAVPGVDALLIGPNDLSYSLGLPRQIHHPSVQAAIATTIRKANAAGIPISMFWHDSVEAYADYLKHGLNFLALGSDYEFMRAAGSELLTQMRAASGSNH